MARAKQPTTARSTRHQSNANSTLQASRGKKAAAASRRPKAQPAASQTAAAQSMTTRSLQSRTISPPRSSPNRKKTPKAILATTRQSSTKKRSPKARSPSVPLQNRSASKSPFRSPISSPQKSSTSDNSADYQIYLQRKAADPEPKRQSSPRFALGPYYAGKELPEAEKAVAATRKHRNVEHNSDPFTYPTDATETENHAASRSSKRRIRNISQDAREQAINVFQTSEAPSVIVEAAHFNPKARRARKHWSVEEEMNLREGIRKHGDQNWAHILNDTQLKFSDERTMVDLKDKWRNIVNYKPYSERPIRRYMLVNEYHQPVLSESGNPHYFNNRYPRDAAAKVASKGENYANGNASIYIYLQEVPLDAGVDIDGSAGKIVHVYEGTRTRQTAVNIEKFRGFDTMWVPSVSKIREERLITREDL